jgi:hypothetical protein
MGHYRQLLARDYEDFVKFQAWRFAPRVNAWMEAALSAPSSLPVFDSFRDREELIPQFQTSLALSEQFVEDRTVQLFLRAETFSTDEKWTALITNHSSHEEIQAIVSSGSVTLRHQEVSDLAYSFWEQGGRVYGHADEDWLKAERELMERHACMAGFLCTLEHMDASRQFFEDVRECGVPSADRFAQKVGEIQVWRLNLWDSIVQNRFEQIAWKATELVAAELNTRPALPGAFALSPSGKVVAVGGADLNDADEFHQTTLMLMQTWKENYRPAQFAYARA